MKSNWNLIKVMEYFLWKKKNKSSHELTTLRNLDIPTPPAGLKRTKVENTPEEQNDLKTHYGKKTKLKFFFILYQLQYYLSLL